jgi:predicted ATPase/DNA-binding winged helix-turn-helix (wHTH) protein
MDPVPHPTASLVFGRFLVSPHRRELLADGQPVRLGGRAFDVLMVLIEARGGIVSKDTLMRRIWPDRAVEENALQVQISALRAAFARERELIRTVTGRGYQFTGEIHAPAVKLQKRASPPNVAVETRSATAPTNVPEPISPLIGRDDELREILMLAASHRAVTLTGSGGIGKTRLALAVAHRLLPRFADGVWLAELAPLSDPRLVAATVATAARLNLGAGDATPEFVARSLTGKRLLLVLDNCEHVIGAAAVMAEELMRANPAAQVIATSREPLKMEGERIFPLSPLAVPAEDAEAGDDVQSYGAVRLFAQRAREADSRFVSGRAVAVIAAICRRLDGIPLAIELAAARAAALGVEELADRLDERFQLLTAGRRTALARHRTLRAALDWSFELLPEPERVILRRLGVFAGAFRLDTASAVIAGPDLTPSDIVEGIANLVARSLVTSDLRGDAARFSLLETMRAYALERLAEVGEREALARRHAEYVRQVFERAEVDWDTRPTDECLAEYGQYIDDVRMALDWAFSPGGDTATGVAITVGSVQLWLRLSMMAECRRHVERALASISGQGSRGEMQLQAALGLSLNYTTGRRQGKEAALTRALEIAESLGDTEYQLLALRGLWAYRVDTGAYRTALALAEQFAELAATRAGPVWLAIGDRMAAIALYVLGDLSNARRRLEHHLARPFPPLGHSRIVRFLMDPRVAIRTHLARILWGQGFPDLATQTARLAVEDAEQKGHTIALCHALAQAACPVALSTGDLPAAERFAAILLGHAGKLRLAGWIARGHCLNATALILRGNFADGLPLLRTALGELREEGVAPGYTGFLAVFARGLGRSGRLMEGLAAIEQALALSHQREEHWNLPELLRTKGELLLLEAAGGAALSAEHCFREALDRAGRDGALSWELRVAISLGRLWRDQGRATEAHDLVASVHGRFTEGFATADLKAARALLEDLRSGRPHCR